MTNTRPPISRRENIVVQDLQDEVLVYDMKTNQAYCLNSTAGLIYQLCDGKNSVAQISDLLSVKLKTLVSEDVVYLALIQFKKDGLLENGEEFSDFFTKVSRREVIKRVGFASMVALPIVASLIAPTSASAASVDCSCVNPGDCIVKTSCPSTVNCNGSMQCAP